MNINFKDKLRNIADGLLIALRFFVVAVVFCYGVIIPLLFLIVRAISILIAPLPGGAGDIVSILLFVAAVLYVSYLTSRGNGKLGNWIQTGHIDIEISDEKNFEMRKHWLKTHDLRTKPKVWRFFLTNKTDLIFLAPVYPERYGSPDVTAEPLNYRALVSITHKFRGNLPITGDEIKFEWVTTPNNDISKLHVRAVEAFPERETKSAVWEELDANGEAGSVCAENIKTGKRIKIQHSVKIAKDCQEGISLCFWNEVNEAEGETVFAYKF